MKYKIDDTIRYIKNLEKEFLKDNLQLYIGDRLNFLRKKQEFIDKRLEEWKRDGDNI